MNPELKGSPKPMSVCYCKHTGDGANSQHTDTDHSYGHGICTVSGCDCGQFMWKDWNEAGKIMLGIPPVS
uniref:Uncharacterized protein n=1 Tax=viral metagenome TaxID=1070528 RepID=A0A6M3L7J8_9ZZZZ